MVDTDGDDYEDLFDLYHSSGNVRDTRPKALEAIEQNVNMADDDRSNSGDDIDSMEVHDLLLEGRKMLLQDLLRAVKGGYASPQEKAILAKMLKDNGMIMGDPFGGREENKTPQRRELPTFSQPDYARDT